MNDLMWILIAVAAVILLAALVWYATRARRSRTLKSQFGAEYDHTVRAAGSRSEAEKELDARRERVARLELRPLSAARRGELRESWRQVEQDFVDHPAAAVAAAEELLRTAMSEHGYPLDGHDAHPEDLSVEHADVMDDYRRAASIATRSARGEASTEDLRQAITRFRSVFESLVGAQRAPRRAAATTENQRRMTT